MQIKCPNCGAVASLDLLLAAEDGVTDVVRIIGEMPPELAKQTLLYLGLFRPQKGKLSWARGAKLLNELNIMVKNAQFERAGKVFSAPLSYWLAGIEQMLSQSESIIRPLKNHGYLLTVMMSLDAKSIKDIEKPKTEKKPPLNITPVLAEEPPSDLMSKDEARATWQKLLGKTKVSPASQASINDDTKRQKAIEELERQAALKQEKHHDE